MDNYKIGFTVDGVITIKAKTEKEAIEKYYDLSWAKIFEKGEIYSIDTELIEVIKETKEDNKPLSTLEKFISDWLGYDETVDERKRNKIIGELSELNSQELTALIQDIIKNF